MKKSYLSWNKDAVTDEKILKDLNELSNGKIQRQGLELAEVKSVPVKLKHKKNGGQRNNKKGSYKY